MLGTLPLTLFPNNEMTQVGSNPWGRRNGKLDPMATRGACARGDGSRRGALWMPDTGPRIPGDALSPQKGFVQTVANSR
jgi:hypothetical protein